MMKRKNLFLLTLIILSAAVFVSAQSVPAGSDFWVTDSRNTYDTLNLPAGYFGSGSRAYSGTVYFAGDPSSGNGFDTKINRSQAVDLSGGSGTTGLVVEELRMKSVSPITVTYDDGRSEQWDVYVTLSSEQRSTGSMTISGDASGGSYSSTLNIIPRFNFVRATGLGEVSEKGRTVKVLDLGSPFIQQYLKQEARLAGERISKGKSTPADEAAVAACQAEPVPTEPTNPTPKPDTTTTQTPTTQNAAAPAKCGVKLTGNGSWGWSRGRFCPYSLAHLAVFARHGVVPFGCP